MTETYDVIVRGAGTAGVRVPLVNDGPPVTACAPHSGRGAAIDGLAQVGYLTSPRCLHSRSPAIAGDPRRWCRGARIAEVFARVGTDVLVVEMEPGLADSIWSSGKSSSATRRGRCRSER